MEFDKEFGHEYEVLLESEKASFVQKMKNLRDQESLNEDPLVRKLGHGANAEIRSAVKSIVEAGQHLNDRAGYAIMSFGARSDYAGTREPFDMIPRALQGFIENSFGITPTRFTQMMETYMMGDGSSGHDMREASSKTLRSEVSERLRVSFGKSLIWRALKSLTIC